MGASMSACLGMKYNKAARQLCQPFYARALMHALRTEPRRVGSVAAQ